MSLCFSNIHISDTQIGRWCLWIIFIYNYLYIYIYIYNHAAVSCKRYPPSLPYIIIVQTCGKQWDLPKFVDALSVTLGFSRLLTYIYIYIVIIHIYIYIVIIYIYIITTLFVGCKHGGRSKNVSNIFDPFVFLSRWEGYMYVRPPQVKNRARKIYIWKGGRKSVIDTSTPPRSPAPVLYG